MSHRRIALMAPWLLLSFVTQAAEQPLVTATVSHQSVPDIYMADAVIEAVNQGTLAAETSGRIKQVLFDVDDVVNKGDVLIRFNDQEQKASLTRAEASLHEAEARLHEAEAEHKRVKSVFAKKLVAQSALDTAEANLKAAQQRVRAAKAGVAQAQEQLAYTVVRAPYAGIVVKRLVEVGESARPGTPLMTGFSLEQLRATASLPQSEVAAVRQSAKASIYLQDPLKPGARLSEISAAKVTVFPYADPETHGFKVRLQLPAGPTAFYPGMLVKAAFDLGTSEHLLVPAKAVVHRSEVTAVYVVGQDGRLGFRQVRVGDRYADDQLDVLAGLSAGEQVALDPVRAGALLKEQRAGRGAEARP